MIACTQDTDGDRTIDQWGWAFETWRMMHGWDNLFAANGGRYFEKEEENGEVKWNSVINRDAGIETLDFLVDIWTMDPKPCYPEFVTSYDHRNLFGLEKIAMYIDGSWCIGIWEDGFPDFKTWDSGIMPKGSGEYVGVCQSRPRSIFKQSKHPDEAYKWLETCFLSEIGQFHMVNKGGYAPTRKDWKDIHVGGLGLTVPPKMQTFVNELPYLEPMEVFPKEEFVSDQIALAMQYALLGEKSSKQALDDAVSKINEMMKYE